MCQLDINQVIGQINSDGDIEQLFIRGTSESCPLLDELSIVPNTPLAKITVVVKHPISGAENSAHVFLSTEDFQSWVVPIKLQALCDDEVLVSAYCSSPDLDCKIEDVPKTVLCGLGCPTVTFDGPHYGACDEDGNRLVSITATVDPALPEPTNVLWLYGGNEDQGEDLFGAQTSVSLVISNEDYAASQSVQFKLSPLCYYTLALEGFEPCGPACPFDLSLVVIDGNGAQVDTKNCLEQASYIVQVRGVYLNNAGFTWQVNGESVGAGAQIIVEMDGPKDVAVTVSQDDCREQSLDLSLTLCDPALVCPVVENLAVYADNNPDALDLDDCLPVGSYVVKAEGQNIAQGTLEWQVDGVPPENVPEANVVGRDLSLFLERDRSISMTITEDGCTTQNAELSIVACENDLIPTPEPTDGRIDWCVIFRVLMLLGIGILLIGLVLVVCPLFTAPMLDVPTTMVIGTAMLGIGLLMAIIFWALWHWICEPDQCAYWKLAWQVAAIVMFVFIYIAFCPGCMWWGLLGLAAMAAFFLLFIQWLSECRPTRCFVFQELLFIMIHIDIIEALQMFLGNCVLTSNSTFAGIWVLILAGFTAVAYWGMQNFCSISSDEQR